MRIAKHTVVTLDNDNVFITSLLSRSVIKMSRTKWEDIADSLVKVRSKNLLLKDELINRMFEDLIIVEDGFNELEYITRKTLTTRAVSDTFGLIIVPSMSCNMNCHYCFENKADSQTLKNQDIVELIRFTREKLLEGKHKQLHLRWFGGEPLINIPLLKNVTSSLSVMCQSQGIKISGDIVTNGFYLNRDVAQFLGKNGLNSAQITFEGDKKQHDKVRRVKSGGSYEQLLENISIASDHLEIRIRIHVAPYNLDTIPNLLQDIHNKGLHKKIGYIYFAPLFNYKQKIKEKAFIPDSRLFLSSEEYAKHLLPLIKNAKELGFKLPDPLNTDYSVCTALREYTAVVNPNGTLVKCYMDAGDQEEIYGTLNAGITNHQNLSKWRKMFFAHDEECRNCKFSPVCLGGCAKEVMSGANKDVICTPLKYNIDQIIPLFYT